MRTPQEQRDELGLRPLPQAAESILTRLNAPPRLVAHLLLVHDVAAQLVTLIRARWPSVDFDSQTVLFGAATHDIGKITYPEELTYSGRQHEAAGIELLVEAGIDAQTARFARTHGSWAEEPIIELEDLVVALADTCWKGGRDDVLEGKLIDMLASATSSERWDIYLALDDIIEAVGADADRRVAWQAKFPVADSRDLA